MIAIVGVYHKYDFIMVPPAPSTSISDSIARITDKWQDVDEQSDTAHVLFPLTSIANEVVCKDCTIED
ncbi:unnamed protein product [Caenorhabditis sp. 36 PRJEB53466]|nr:unnamed protein product [Caenorhabditis sp. 36 PRJEB53466]